MPASTRTMKTDTIAKVFFVALILQVCLSKVYSDIWGESPRLENFDVLPDEPMDTVISKSKYLCNSTDRCFGNRFFDALAGKKQPRQFLNRKIKKSQTISVPSCACGMEYKILDLGMRYYPRYLPTVACKIESCWMGSYRCRPKHYEVKVLKRRDDDDELLNTSMPGTLQEEWVTDVATVTVACECTL